ncbi:MAG: trypsin-like serine protease [Deltaproteobacteria bacterium]|nr:MAG: trypsin-like serine protease [Deltaproteobacteria bacterium]
MRYLILVLVYHFVLFGAIQPTRAAPAASRPALKTQGASITIIGGVPDNKSKFSGVVMVNGSCSGTLVNPKLVVTAAHCVCWEYTPGSAHPDADRRMDTSKCDTIASVMLLRDGKKQTLQGQVTVHPRFFINIVNKSISSSEADLAVIHLDKPAHSRYATHTMTRAFPTVGQPLTIVGFGHNNCGNTGFGIRRIGTNKIAAVSSDIIDVDRSTTGSAITWKGDSGGPLFVQRVQGGITKYILTGVTSYGRCGIDAGYTNVFTYSRWLNSMIPQPRGVAMLSQCRHAVGTTGPKSWSYCQSFCRARSGKAVCIRPGAPPPRGTMFVSPQSPCVCTTPCPYATEATGPRSWSYCKTKCQAKGLVPLCVRPGSPTPNHTTALAPNAACVCKSPKS